MKLPKEKKIKKLTIEQRIKELEKQVTLILLDKLQEKIKAL